VIDGIKFPIERNGFLIYEEDLMMFAMLTDPVYLPELTWKDPTNRQYGGCYRVRDYQYQINRCEETNAIFACARSIGKTESEKVHSQKHAIESEGENMLITAPELIHLLPLTDAIENNLSATRLTRELLDDRQSGKTGFTHRPFGADFKDGTKIVGRIPKITGTGVKGQHQPFLIVEEGQDYPDKGWTEVEETVNHDAIDQDGRPRYRFWIFGVHSGNRNSGFAERARSKEWALIKVTRLMRPDWGKEAKERARAAYGGTSSPDYRRNILGEPGDAASAYFVTARLMACVDQQVERGEVKGSDYNNREYVHQLFRAEELDTADIKIADALDLPSGYSSVYGGMDVGLNRSPSVISLFTEAMVGKELRLKLFRRYTLERFRSKQLRQALYAIGWHFGGSLMGLGIDSTGLGLPLMQELEDDEFVPPNMMAVTRGYFFNSKVPVNVAEEHVFKDQLTGVVKDQYGNAVKEETLPDGSKRFVTYAPFIIASTRYLAEWVDSGKMLLPFDTEITTDMMGETKQRVEGLRQAAERGVTRKPDMFHILDSFRAMAMAYHAADIEEQLAIPEGEPVFDYVI
jgi:hypothetical protein